MALLEVRDLSVTFASGGQPVEAVRKVGFELDRGQTLAIVGESGSGKSVTALSILQLLPYPLASHPSGTIRFDGQELIGRDDRFLRTIRGRRIGMIFQEPMTSLNPLHSVERQITEVLFVHRGLGRAEARARALELLRLVRISDPETRLASFPHQLSGGQRQRVMIAMALANEPDILIADEPTTALDVTVQAQIMKLLGELQAAFGMATILVTHDLGVIAGFCREVMVMYGGRVMEKAPVDPLFESPTHPYTRGLIGAIPRLDIAQGEVLVTIPGQPPDMARAPAGCPFAPRCPEAGADCDAAMPALLPFGTGRARACHRSVEALA